MKDACSRFARLDLERRVYIRKKHVDYIFLLSSPVSVVYSSFSFRGVRNGIRVVTKC